MSQTVGHVGDWSLSWKSVPHGNSGEAVVQIQKKGASVTDLTVRWRRDSQGIWVELPHGLYGFDLEAEQDEEGRFHYHVRWRNHPETWTGLHYSRFSEEGAGAVTPKKKGTKVRAQMPGKILKVFVKLKDAVEKGQPLAVMEAMKMENEIRSPATGQVARVAIEEGQTLETGADLFVIE